MEKLCDSNCNECEIIMNSNSRMVTKILNRLYKKFGDGVLEIVNEECPNLSVCLTCRIDDFCHSEGCELGKLTEE